MLTASTSWSNHSANCRCSDNASGVVLLATVIPSSSVAPKVPITPQGLPKVRVSCATIRLVVVLPLVPVIPNTCIE